MTKSSNCGASSWFQRTATHRTREGGSQELLVTDGQDDRGGLSGCRGTDASGRDVDCVSLEHSAGAAATCQGKNTKGEEDDSQKANLLST
jgi:hypothetical protein